MGLPRKIAAASQPATGLAKASRAQDQSRAAVSIVISHDTPWTAASGAKSRTRANSISVACGKTGKRRSAWKSSPPDAAKPRAKGR